MPEVAALQPAAREEWLDWVLEHDRALRQLLGGRRAPPVEAVRQSWRALLCAALHRLPDDAVTRADAMDGLLAHLEALRAAGVPSADVVAAVNAWRMGRT
ncbi:MAG: hypothetical protein RIB84_22460 [Sneathiellaceae bacterium]